MLKKKKKKASPQDKWNTRIFIVQKDGKEILS